MNYVANTIGWATYTINPIKGLCQGGCWYCYARRMYQRFKWNKEIRLDLSVLDNIDKIKEPSRIFLCSTHELFGEWIPDKWIFDIITKCQKYSQHIFLLLTKNPKRYLDFTFRDNFWLGETITDDKRTPIMKREKGITFISYEPLMSDVIPIFRYTNWVIIGALTGRGLNCDYKYPRETWIRHILEAADKFNVPVFMKNNLKPYWEGEFRQEFP